MRKILKLTALALILTMLLQIMPMQAIAEEVNPDGSEASLRTEAMLELDEDMSDGYMSSFDDETQDQSEVPVLYEEEDERTETSKTYRLENGNSTIIMYDDPIHKEEDGEWVDIDNTLEIEYGQYINTDGIFDAAFEQEIEDGNTVTVSDDDYEITWGIIYDDKESDQTIESDYEDQASDSDEETEQIEQADEEQPVQSESESSEYFKEPSPIYSSQSNSSKKNRNGSNKNKDKNNKGSNKKIQAEEVSLKKEKQFKSNKPTVEDMEIKSNSNSVGIRKQQRS